MALHTALSASKSRDRCRSRRKQDLAVRRTAFQGCPLLARSPVSKPHIRAQHDSVPSESLVSIAASWRRTLWFEFVCIPAPAPLTEKHRKDREKKATSLSGPMRESASPAVPMCRLSTSTEGTISFGLWNTMLRF